MGELAKDTKLQQELHEEVVAASGDDVEGIKLKGGITKIPKLRAFIHEVLRIHSPAPTSGFRKIEDDGIKVGDYNIAKGTVAPWINVAANFFSFHSGKRGCPGQALAMK